jgi:hypothetical protein
MSANRSLSHLGFFSDAQLAAKVFPALHHLGTRVAEGATAEGYREANPIPQKLIATIDGWIRSLHSTSSTASR